VVGAKVMDAITPVSIPPTVTVLQVNVFKGILVRLANAKEPVFGI
jgi:hypothetical protein